MIYYSIPIMVCQLATTAYPNYAHDLPIMERQVAVEMNDPSLHPTGKIGAYYERRMPIDAGHGFTIYLFEYGGCIKAPGYLSSEKRI